MRFLFTFILIIAFQISWAQVQPRQLDPCEDSLGNIVEGCFIVTGTDGKYYETTVSSASCDGSNFVTIYSDVLTGLPVYVNTIVGSDICSPLFPSVVTPENDGSYTHTSGDGTNTTISFLLQDNGDGTFSIINSIGQTSSSIPFGYTDVSVNPVTNEVTFTYPDGVTTVNYDETLTSISLNADNINLDYIDEDGALTQLDFTNLVTNLETISTLTFNGVTNILTYVDEDGNVTNVNLTQFYDGLWQELPQNGAVSMTPISTSNTNRLVYPLTPDLDAVGLSRLVYDFDNSNLGAGTSIFPLTGWLGGSFNVNFGEDNSIDLTSNNSSVLGGSSNTIGNNSFASTISGGQDNIINSLAIRSVIGGGYNNAINTLAYNSAILGGESNTIDERSIYNVIGGGFQNTIGDPTIPPTGDVTGSVIAGGVSNTIRAAGAGVLLGGQSNSLDSGAWNVIGGGRSNFMSSSAFVFGFFNVISGGEDNTILGDSRHCFIGGGEFNLISDSPLPTALKTTHSSILGGSNNTLEARYSSIGGGEANSIDVNTSYAFISGGEANLINSNADYSAIINGENNSISASVTNSAIVGGSGYLLTQSNSVAVPTLIIHSIAVFPDHATALASGLPSGSVYKLSVGNPTPGVSNLYIID